MAIAMVEVVGDEFVRGPMEGLESEIFVEERILLQQLLHRF